MANVEKRFGKYEIREGSWRKEGGMGIVYKAYDPSLERIVAIKTIKDKPRTERSLLNLLTRFDKEAKIGGGILKEHINIATVYEYNCENDYNKNQYNPFICMEFIKGDRLDELLVKNKRKEYFSLEQTIHIISQLLEVLDFIHRKKVIHQDINPNNIMLTEEGTLKLIDFGIAKIGTKRYTYKVKTHGTPEYSSPEQLYKMETDYKTDIFSTGLILYELLTGKKAFGEFQIASLNNDSEKNELDELEKLAEREEYYNHRFQTIPKNPSEINQQLTMEFNLVVQTALQAEPANRFETAQTFLEALLEAYTVWLCKKHYKQNKTIVRKLLKSFWKPIVN